MFLLGHFALLFIFITNVFGLNTPCLFDDVPCLTKSTNAVYPKIIAGLPGTVECSDPILLDVIYVNSIGLNYTLSNAKMTGLKDCQVTQVTLYPEQDYFVDKLSCQSITIEGDYEVSGQLDNISVKGKGKSKITYDKYNIVLEGSYMNFADDIEDNHFKITSFTLGLKPKTVTADYTGLVVGTNKEGAGEDFVELEKKIRYDVMYTLFKKFVINVNAYQNAFAVKDLYFAVTD